MSQKTDGPPDKFIKFLLSNIPNNVQRSIHSAVSDMKFSEGESVESSESDVSSVISCSETSFDGQLLLPDPDFTNDRYQELRNSGLDKEISDLYVDEFLDEFHFHFNSFEGQYMQNVPYAIEHGVLVRFLNIYFRAEKLEQLKEVLVGERETCGELKSGYEELFTRHESLNSEFGEWIKKYKKLKEDNDSLAESLSDNNAELEHLKAS